MGAGRGRVVDVLFGAANFFTLIVPFFLSVAAGLVVDATNRVGNRLSLRNEVGSADPEVTAGQQVKSVPVRTSPTIGGRRQR